MAKRLAFEELGHHVRRALMGADIEHDEDVGVIERGRCPRLELEATKTVGIAGKRRRQRLERNVASQTRVTSLVDLAHAAGANCALYFIDAKPGARRESHSAGKS